MNSLSESQPITNGEKQIKNNEDRQEPVTEGNSGENSQTNIHSPTNLRTLKNNKAEKELFGFNIKQIVRYVTIQVPPKKAKPDGQNVSVVDTVGKKLLDSLPKQIKVMLKPPRKSDGDVILIADENDFQETVEVVNAETPAIMSLNNSSDGNYDSTLHSKGVFVDKKSVVDQETQTDIYGWLYKNGKLYSVISDASLQCVTNEVPILKTTWNNYLGLINSNHNEKSKVTHNASRNCTLKMAVPKKILPATNSVDVDEIFISDDSLSGDEHEEFQPVENSSLASSISSKVNEEESGTQSNLSLSENLYTHLIVPEQSSDLPIENGLNNDSNQFTRPQETLFSLINENCDQSLSTKEQNQKMMVDHTTSTPGSSIIQIPSSLESIPFPNKFVAHSRTGNKNKMTRTDLSTFLVKLVQELKDCVVEDEFGNIPLQQAVIDDDIKKIKSQCILLRSMKYDLNHVNSRQETALMVAVKMMLYSENNPSCKAVEMLLKEGVDQTITDIEGYTPLHYAVKAGCGDLTKLLLESNKWEEVINKFGNDGLVPIHLAAVGNHPEIIAQLVNKGCDINAQDRKSGRTPYFLARDSKNMEAIKALIILEANLSTQNYAGQCPPNTKSIKKLIDLKDNVLRKPSVVVKKARNYFELKDVQESVLLARPPSTSDSLDTHGNIVGDNVNTKGRGSIKKQRLLSEMTNSLSDKSNSSQAVSDTVSGSFSDKLQNRGSSKTFVLGDTGICQKNGNEMFANGRNNYEIQSNIELLNHSPILVRDKISPGFKIPQKTLPKQNNRKTNDNKVRVIKSMKGNLQSRRSPLLKKSFTSETSDRKKVMFRSEITNNPSVSYDKGSVKTMSCSSFVIDNVNILETLSDGVINNESAVSDDKEFGVKTGNCTLVAIDYGNGLDTCSYDKTNNESLVTDDNSSVKAASCTSFVIDNVNTLGTLSDFKINKDLAVIDYSSVNSSVAVVGNYEFSMHSPSQEIVNVVVPHDLQLEQTDVYKDSDLKHLSDEKTNITSKLNQTNKERKNKRKNTEIRFQNRTKKSKKK